MEVDISRLFLSQPNYHKHQFPRKHIANSFHLNRTTPSLTKSRFIKISKGLFSASPVLRKVQSVSSFTRLRDKQPNQRCVPVSERAGWNLRALDGAYGGRERVVDWWLPGCTRGMMHGRALRCFPRSPVTPPKKVISPRGRLDSRKLSIAPVSWIRASACPTRLGIKST